MEAFLLLDGADPELRVAAAGGDLDDLTGLSAEQVIDRRWPPLWRADEDAHSLEILRGAVRAGGGARVHLRTLHASRGAIETEVAVHALWGDSRFAVCRISEPLDAAEMAHLAFHDRLTGLANRALLERHLSVALPAALRRQSCVVVLFIDLDRFKEVNDRLGHAAGDDVLRETARRLGGVVRADDVLARLGGDEFVLVLNDVDGEPRDAADAIARQIEQALAAPIVLGGGDRCHVGASIGMSIFPSDGTDSAALLASADAMMYRHKRTNPERPRIDSSTELAQLLERAGSIKNELAQTRQTYLEVTGRTSALAANRTKPTRR